MHRHAVPATGHRLTKCRLLTCLLPPPASAPPPSLQNYDTAMDWLAELYANTMNVM